MHILSLGGLIDLLAPGMDSDEVLLVSTGDGERFRVALLEAGQARSMLQLVLMIEEDEIDDIMRGL